LAAIRRSNPPLLVVVGDDGQDVRIVEDQELLVVDLDLGASPLRIEDTLANFNFHRRQLAVVETAAGADCHDRALLGLLPAGVREVNAAAGHLVVSLGFDDDPIPQRPQGRHSASFVPLATGVRLHGVAAHREDASWQAVGIRSEAR
jgi:hypothetical protein